MWILLPIASILVPALVLYGIQTYREKQWEKYEEEMKESKETQVIDNTEITDEKLIYADTGSLGQREMRFLGMTNQTVDYLLTRAETDNKSPAQIIDDLVSKEITASV